MCKREALVIALLTLGSIVAALVISACVVLGTELSRLQ
jgi:hypothetical protein